MDTSSPFMTLRTRRPANDGSSMSSADSAYGSASEGSPAATHDISRVSYHVKHLESFAQALQDSASRAFPNRGRTSQRYSKVHALMLHWKSDDLFVLPELEDLEKCLRENYCFETDIFSIPSDNSHLELMLKVGDMVKQHESEDTLFIIYYGGHARIDESRQSTWCANRRPGSPWLQWSAIQTLLERSMSDVLILLDCCAGAASATFPTGQSITETISASSWDAIAPDPGRYSFTNALIEVLQEWSPRTFSAAMLHAEILARLKHPRPILINGKHFEARSTPLSYWHRPSDPRMIEGRSQQYPLPVDCQIPNASEPTEDEPHVMISLALEEDQRLDINAWETWLAGFPALAKYVKIQGVFKSHSTLLLMSLPVMVWDLLPDDPACSFVAFIRSNNLLRAQKTGPAPASVHAPVTSEIPDPSALHEYAESVSGTTIAPSENIDIIRRGTAASSINRNVSALPAQESSLNSRVLPRAESCGLEYTSLDSPLPGSSTVSAFQQPMPPLAGSLRNVASTTSLGTIRRPQPTLRAFSTTAGSDIHPSSEGISRTMIINQSRSSKKSVFGSDQDVPQGQLMAPHVIQRLEDYFQKDSDPSVGIVEHLASNLGVETTDIHIWFHHRREQEQMTYNLQNLRIDANQRQVQDGSRMILPGHLNDLLEIYPSKGILIVDLRSSTDFEMSHIHDAINLRAPQSFVENTSLEMIEDTFMDDHSRRSFSKWFQHKCVVFYDKVIEFDWECPVAEALYNKFKRKGWQGQCFILKGHYREFSTSFDKYISGAKMTSEAKEYVDGLRQQSSPTEEEANKQHERYDKWLHAFVNQHRVPTVDLIPARKLERRRAVEQHQKELETEFEARFPALYRKAQAMRPPRPPSVEEEAPSPIPPSPPPPFRSEQPWEGQSFRHVNWTGTAKVDEDDFDLRKAPLVEPLANGLEKMRELARAETGIAPPQAQKGYHHQRTEDYPEKGKMTYYTEDYEHDDYEEIDPKSEGLGNDPGFQKAGAQAGIGGGAKMQERGGGSGSTGGEETSGKKTAKKRPQHLWERLRSGAGR
ncbi:Homeobox protein EgHBX4 [Madurella mycetomatis]|uniref:Homeobox protein EgHBX4 n=1 Tax=Madurella mycetomatis TaxID=100816 RepID=A0A175VP25_9PEZI|nr:Homeobox protein EgHBX4 [Madurella mycetomatis]